MTLGLHAVGKPARKGAILVLVSVFGHLVADERHQPLLRILLLDQILASLLAQPREKNTFVPLSSVLVDIEYSGPSSSIVNRSPAPTKLHDVVASTMIGAPVSSS